ncbi:uncharacterized protein LOC106161170 [Lingula anatina]|uniref:Uncharacterized protein LOC106161170 n=1 Tax=Lingula anatina TaxID=7574 RepID=A0A1S3I5E4_LINAN|nr:uncharacterized protein LOC106161170 [Lingula anatina]XP_013393496.1 uncharacterized protein LOC106161170 [Lingula anatina]|eukprot:XP_013393495.1 uncharacterized protein LOC106161170 [Lingula anatina]
MKVFMIVAFVSQALLVRAQNFPNPGTNPGALPVPQQEYDVDEDAEYCRRCIQSRNGVGYYEDPNDCRAYLHCSEDQYGRAIAFRMGCASGSLWEQRVSSCVSCTLAQCFGSRLPPGVARCPPTTPPPPTTTVGPTILPQFAGSCVAANDPAGWTYHAVPGGQNIFYREKLLGDERKVEKVSCGPWIFDLTICACRTPPRQAIAVVPFDSTPFITLVDNFYIDGYGVGVGAGKVDGAAIFNGTSHVEIPRFNNYPWGAGLTLSFWFSLADNNPNVKKGLLNNGDCQVVPTIQFNYQNGRLIGQIIVASNTTLQTVTVNIATSELQNPRAWHHVVLVYDGLKVRVFVNNRIAIDEIAVGIIPSTLAPLLIGRDLHCEFQEGVPRTNIIGAVDELQIYDWPMDNNQVSQLNAGVRNIQMDPYSGYTIG